MMAKGSAKPYARIFVMVITKLVTYTIWRQLGKVLKILPLFTYELMSVREMGPVMHETRDSFIKSINDIIQKDLIEKF